MVNQTKTLERLNKERDYEDNLVENLNSYFIECLGDITELSKEQRKKVEVGLKTIVSESRKHSVMFNELIQVVVNNGDDDY